MHLVAPNDGRLLQTAEQRFRTRLNDVQEATLATNEARSIADRLRALLLEARRTLDDPQAAPTAYPRLAEDIAKTVPTAEAQLTALRDLRTRPQAPEDLGSLLDDLTTLTADARPLRDALEQRWSAWLQFVQERDAANAQLDVLRRPLEAMYSKPPVPLRDAQADLLAIKVGAVWTTGGNCLDEFQTAHDRLDELKPTMLQLQRLSEALEPLEAPYADVRFFDVDVEQSQQNYDARLCQSGV